MKPLYFLLLFLFFGTPIYGFYKYREDIYNYLTKSIFIRHISRFMLLLFGLITFIFGIHASTISSYDKFSNKVNHSFNWIYIWDIIRFPLHQFNLNNNEITTSVLQLDEYNGGILKDHIYTMLVDKTGSISGTNLDNYRQKLRINLALSLADEINITREMDKKIIKDFSDLPIEDLFLLHAINNLGKNSKSAKIDIVFYLGDNIFTSLSDAPLILNNDNRQQVLNKYWNFLLSDNYKGLIGDINKRNTNFAEIALELKLPKRCSNKEYKNKHSTLFILSDFEHENTKTNITFERLKQEFYELTATNIDQVTLIKIRGINKSPINSSRTIYTIKEIFNHTYLYEFNDLLYQKNKGSQDIDAKTQIAYYFSVLDNSKTEQPIIFYNTWNKDLRSLFQYQANIKFVKNSKTGKEDSTPNLIITLGEDFTYSKVKEEYKFLILDRKEKLVKNVPKKVNISLDLIKSATLNLNSIPTSNYYLEFNHPGSSKIVREPIIFRDVLPMIPSLILLILYAILFVALTSFIFYLIIKSKGTELNIFFQITSLWYILLTILLIFNIWEELLTAFKSQNWTLNVTVVLLLTLELGVLNLLGKYSLENSNKSNA
jgi:hypothetical protein